MPSNKNHNLQNMEFHTEVYYPKSTDNKSRTVIDNDYSGQKDTSTKVINYRDYSGQKDTSTKVMDYRDYSGQKDISIHTEVIRDNSHTTGYRGLTYAHGGWFPSNN